MILELAKCKAAERDLKRHYLLCGQKYLSIDSGRSLYSDFHYSVSLIIVCPHSIAKGT